MMKLTEQNRLSNHYRREAREMWNQRSPFRQQLYIKYRLSGKSPNVANRLSRNPIKTEKVVQNG